MEVSVPLSEEEMRLLEQMERALVEEDPRLAHTLRGTAHRASARRRVWLAGAAVVVGLAVLFIGAVMRQTVVGVLGFVVMLAAATVGMSAWHQMHDEGETGSERAPRPQPSDPGAVERFLDRFRRDR